MDTRHSRRIEIVQNLFAYGFTPPGTERLPHDVAISQHVIDSLIDIDKTIASIAVKFPIEKIAKIDLAILRLAVYELMVDPKEPKKVVINEAVELAKELGGEKSYSFVNGVLGKLITNNEKQV